MQFFPLSKQTIANFLQDSLEYNQCRICFEGNFTIFLNDQLLFESVPEVFRFCFKPTGDYIIGLNVSEWYYVLVSKPWSMKMLDLNSFDWPFARYIWLQLLYFEQYDSVLAQVNHWQVQILNHKSIKNGFAKLNRIALTITVVLLVHFLNDVILKIRVGLPEGRVIFSKVPLMLCLPVPSGLFLWREGLRGGLRLEQTFY